MRGERGAQRAEPARVAASETLSMLRRYVVQETVGPFKHILRSVLLGVSGALLLGVGTIVLLLAVLRVLQTETGTTFAGTWSFAPFLLTATAALVVAGGATFAGLKGARRGGRDQGEKA
ncbi:MAG: putative Holin-X, holin superfamily [Acidimicrobiaceae bacterium]|nr:putative Holin-X, holin superfamily [Acidimicrobiaceae bacterium]